MPAKKAKKDWSDIKKRIKGRKTKYKADERIFVPTFNEKNIAKVTMRFLDSIDTDMPYVTQSGHFFNDVGGWFIENCPSTIEHDCPVCQDLYDNGYYEKDYDLYSDRKKNTSFYTNVLIIEDKNCPANEGKVFIFKYGAKIMAKIDDVIEDDLNPWDEDEGVNFKFSAKKNGKMSNYDASSFSDAETELGQYGSLKTILGDRHDLGGFIDPSEFKSAEDIKKKYLKVIGEDDEETTKPKRTRKPVQDEVEDEEILEDIDEGIEGDIGDETMLDESDDDDDAFFSDLEDDDDE